MICEKPIMIIPAAGAGKRFADVGFKNVKPFIKVSKTELIIKNRELNEVDREMSMIGMVLENIGELAGKVYVIIQKAWLEEYKQDIDNLKKEYNSKEEFLNFITVDKLTEGAACTVLLSKEFIDNDRGLIIANSDQWIDCSLSHLSNYFFNRSNNGVDGLILSFPARGNKWSYAKLDESEKFVAEVAEKVPISEQATVGIYFWKQGRDFVKYAEEMIAKNVRVNNEFYVCPVFNQAIAGGKKFLLYPVVEMWGLGTPDDVEKFVKEFPYYQFMK